MAKITIDDITGQFTSVQAINDRLQQVEDELNNKVLYRDNPVGEPNDMSNDLDMNDNDILNLRILEVDSLSIGGTPAVPTELAGSELPVQTGQSGKFLTTNGNTAAWALVDDSLFDTVADMKSADLQAGFQAKTKGYLTAGDGGSGTYLIVGNQTVDGFGDHLLTNGNVALLQTGSKIDVAQYGAVGDGVADDTLAVQAAADKAGVVTFTAGKTYKLTTSISVGSDTTIEANKAKFNVADVTGPYISAFHSVGALSGTTTNLTANLTSAAYSASVVDSSGFTEGDWVLVHSEDPITHYDGGTYIVHQGEFVRVRSTAAGVINFTTPIITGTFTTGNTARITKVDFKENIHIRNAVIVGSNTPGDTENGIQFRYVDNFSITGCEVIDVDIYSIEVSACNRGNIQDNRIKGVFYDGVTGTVFYGVSVLDCSSHINVGNNLFERVRHGVITTSRSNGQGFWGEPLYVNIHHNDMFDAMAGGAGRSWGFEQHGFGRYISFNNNFVNGAYGGVNVDAGFQVQIYNNVFTNISHYGIDLGDSAIQMGNIHIHGNHISVETADVVVNSIGIVLQSGVTDVNDIVIQDNNIISFAGPNSTGILLRNVSGDSRGVVVKGNNMAPGPSGQDADSGYAIACYLPEVEITLNSLLNYKQGIYIDPTAIVNVVAKNTLKYDTPPTSGFGIYAGGNSSIIDGNNLKRPYVGINVPAGTSSVHMTNNNTKGAVSTSFADAGTGTTNVNNNAS